MTDKDILTSLVCKFAKETATPKAMITFSELWMLVEFAVKHEEITLSRASELTGVPLSLWRQHLGFETGEKDVATGCIADSDDPFDNLGDC